MSLHKGSRALPVRLTLKGVIHEINAYVFTIAYEYMQYLCVTIAYVHVLIFNLTVLRYSLLSGFPPRYLLVAAATLLSLSLSLLSVEAVPPQ